MDAGKAWQRGRKRPKFRNRPFTIVSGVGGQFTWPYRGISEMDKAAFWDGMTALGRTGAATHLAAGAEFPRTPVRPANLDRAEAMQMSLGRRLP
jgi:hypothetical protein